MVRYGTVRYGMVWYGTGMGRDGIRIRRDIYGMPKTFFNLTTSPQSSLDMSLRIDR